jgi:hypothetical protein
MSLVFSLGLAFRRQPSVSVLPVALPVNTALPAITGTAQQGQTLTASTGTWTNSPTGHAWQWRRGGTPISGATGGTYALVAADVGAAITVQVTASNAGGASAPATSAATVPVIAAEPVAFAILDPFSTLTNLTSTVPTTLSQTTPIFGSNGSAAIALNGAFGVNNVTRASVPFPGVAATDLICYAIEPPANPMDGEVGPAGVTFHNSYAFRSDGANNEPSPTGSGVRYGARWISMSADSIRDVSWAGTPLHQLAPGSYRLMPTPTFGNIVGGGTARLGPVVRVTQRRKPILCMTFDDINDGHLIARDMMMARLGTAPGTSYVTTSRIGVAARLSLANMDSMRAQGWAFSLDSGTTGEPIWAVHGGSIADAVTALNAHRDALVATGRATFDEASHVAYSWGPTSPLSDAVETVANCTSAGGTTITTTGTFYSAGAMRGVVIKAPGIPAGTTIVSCPNATTIIVNQNVPAGTYTLTMCCINTLQSGGGLVANGTTTITSIRTSGLVTGMTMQGRGVPVGTMITAINTESTGTAADGTITVSNNIPAACTRGAFYIAGAEWLNGNLEAALIAAGFKTGRRTKAVGSICTQFGIPSPMAMMSLWSLDFEPASSAPAIGALRLNIRDGRDTITLSHNTSSFNQTIFGQVLDFVAARVTAGELDVMTVPAWYNRIAARSGVS